VIIYLLSHALLLAFPAQLPERADEQGLQRAEHGKPKSCAENRHTYGQNTFTMNFQKSIIL
jgi:hypothetical protein